MKKLVTVQFCEFPNELRCAITTISSIDNAYFVGCNCRDKLMRRRLAGLNASRISLRPACCESHASSWCKRAMNRSMVLADSAHSSPSAVHSRKFASKYSLYRIATYFADQQLTRIHCHIQQIVKVYRRHLVNVNLMFCINLFAFKRVYSITYFS